MNFTHNMTISTDVKRLGNCKIVLILVLIYYMVNLIYYLLFDKYKHL